MNGKYFKWHRLIIFLIGLSILISCQILAQQGPPPGEPRIGETRPIKSTFKSIDRGNGSVSGRVVDPSGKPISEAEVSIYGTKLKVVTDNDGKYLIDNIPVASPRYILVAKKKGSFCPQSRKYGAK